MKYRKRIYYTEADKALMWDRWQKGDTLHEIAELSGLEGDLKAPAWMGPDVLLMEPADGVVECLADPFPQSTGLFHGVLAEVHVGVIAGDVYVSHGRRLLQIPRLPFLWHAARSAVNCWPGEASNWHQKLFPRGSIPRVDSDPIKPI